MNPHSEFILSVYQSLQLLPHRITAQQVKTLTSLCTHIERYASDKEADVKRMLTVAYNELKSLRDGLPTGDATVKDIRSAMSAIDRLRDDMESLERRKEAVKPGSLDPPPTDRTQQVLNKYKKWEQLVPDVIQKKYMIIRCPIVLDTDPPLSLKKLKSQGMGEDFLGGSSVTKHGSDVLGPFKDKMPYYPVVLNQVMLGMNMSFLEKDNKDATEIAVQKVIDYLKESKHLTFHHLGTPHWRTNVKWAWLATPREVAKLNAACGGHFKLRSWSFPFERSQHTGLR